ncbi:MAG: hypothetical protein A2600_02850 [Candidatus Lambdaproteobacteria bacterium RIFOXYD1_FULL_56_27]|uniref:DUF4160 domain-containing protein n=1 Tax=Candidatus Lambdaproteobacteria bacterium RIFOXYD2_FULL_56_26 TaxID=1817773 RepID=A0A1F6H340_9PROT|nr:MAG: hypothetical protein A2557_06915 [Candidatus Lambdaproteobacteria bacterium RIFOXYD2_FULL_56_26]OGH05336.1 MAG: hypothetical protein A2426_05240 [Candidatus Lambdaproteobacteria bacterium RIFOXYC1_FULL_56_13]OGH09178.1 MAG: hypothetical protein A2600_02850 [Candidatus Lambdaproteobacteria bacterium RIFOXYD1_FULL_56_27]
MPTLLIVQGFRFFFYLDEHEPKHIHVVYAQETAKINLNSLFVVKHKMKEQTLRMALALTKEHQSFFLEKWDEYFGD